MGVLFSMSIHLRLLTNQIWNEEKDVLVCFLLLLFYLRFWSLWMSILKRSIDVAVAICVREFLFVNHVLYHDAKVCLAVPVQKVLSCSAKAKWWPGCLGE